MADPLAAVESVLGSRLPATALVIAVVLGVRYGINRLRRRDGWSSGRRTELLLSVLLTAVTGSGIVILVDLWELIGPLARSYRNLGLQDIAGRMLLAVVILATTYALTDLVGRIIGEFTGTRSSISEHQREIIYRLTQVTLYTLAILVVVGLFTRDLGSLLVGAGFLGIVVGMAARQTLGAVLAGFVVLFSRPFEVGDWIVVEDTEGVVRDITIVNTRIRTVDGETVMVPNDIITGTTVRNRSRQGRLRIEVEVGVDYDTDLDAALSIAADAMTDLDTVLDAPEPHAVLEEFGDSAVVVSLRFWIDNPSARRYWRARTAVVRAVKAAFEAEGITIPFPQRELSTRGDGRVDAVDPAAEDVDQEAPATAEDAGDDDD